MVLDDDALRKEFAKRLSLALSEHPPTASPHGRATYLARKLGVTPKAASKWINGDSVPRDAKLKEIAKILGVSPVWLRDGDQEGLYKYQPISNISTAVQKINDITHGLPIIRLTAQLPILNSTQATRPSESIAAGDIEGFLGVQSDMRLGKEAFYYRLDDDSMVSAERDVFRKGALVLIDPDLPIEPGMFVLARVTLRGIETAVFRAYFEREEIDGFESFELVPINRAVKTIRVERPGDGQILGGLAMVSMPATDMRYG